MSPNSDANNVLQRLRTSAGLERDDEGVLDELLLRSPEKYPHAIGIKLGNFPTDDVDKENAMAGAEQLINKYKSPSKSRLAAFSSPLRTRNLPPSPKKTPKSKPIDIPRFYFPGGEICELEQDSRTLEEDRIRSAFGKQRSLTVAEFAGVCSACSLSPYLRQALFAAAVRSETTSKDDEEPSVSLDGFLSFWKTLSAHRLDAVSRLFGVLAGENTYVTAQDLHSVVDGAMRS